MKLTIRTGLLAAFLVGLMAMACNVDDSYEEDYNLLDYQVEDLGPTAIFDPLNGIIPMPNDLAAIISSMVKVDLSSPGRLAPQQATDQISVSAYADFDVPLDEVSLTGNVLVFEKQTGSNTLTMVTDVDLVQEFGANALGNGPRLHINFSASPMRHSYVVAILDTIIGAPPHDAPLQAGATFYIIKNREPLIDDADQPTVALLAEVEGGAEIAKTAEMLRQVYQPTFTILEENGYPREDVALAWTFSVSP